MLSRCPGVVNGKSVDDGMPAVTPSAQLPILTIARKRRANGNAGSDTPTPSATGAQLTAKLIAWCFGGLEGKPRFEKPRKGAKRDECGTSLGYIATNACDNEEIQWCIRCALVVSAG